MTGLPGAGGISFVVRSKKRNRFWHHLVLWKVQTQERVPESSVDLKAAHTSSSYSRGILGMTQFMTDQWKFAINNPITTQHWSVPPTCLEYQSLHRAAGADRPGIGSVQSYEKDSTILSFAVLVSHILVQSHGQQKWHLYSCPYILWTCSASLIRYI